MGEIDNIGLVCLIPACSFLESRKLALAPGVMGSIEMDLLSL